MPDRPILREDAALYLEHVNKHGLTQDTAWLLDVGRFPVGCCVLDVGCGSGTLVTALAGDKRFARSVIGVELSPELASHAHRIADDAGGTVVQADFLSWTPPPGWQPDTVVMSYFLHHTHDIGPHLRQAAALLPHGGRLYVLDRLAVDLSALNAFPRYWEDHYRDAHEWNEEMPQLATVEILTTAAQQAGFSLVQRQVCPHDHRSGAERFPKTFMEFWRHETGRTFPAVLVVSPAHQAHVEEICLYLCDAGLPVAAKHPALYSDDLIRTIYERCPWRDLLLRFVGEACRARIATAVRINGDDADPELLSRLSQFKKRHRDRWPNIDGPIQSDGFRAIILPFHVPEPHEAEALAHVVGLSAGVGRS
jgi:SAM-dependent methyltransferase